MWKEFSRLICGAYCVPILREYFDVFTAILPEIAELVNGAVPIFVDCEIKTGMDVFKALALGATGACIGRPLMAAIKDNQADGVKDYLLKANGELGKVMAYTGCYNLRKMDPTVIRRI